MEMEMCWLLFGGEAKSRIFALEGTFRPYLSRSHFAVKPREAPWPGFAVRSEGAGLGSASVCNPTPGNGPQQFFSVVYEMISSAASTSFL